MLQLFRVNEADKRFAHQLHDIFGFYPHNIELYRLAFRHKSVSERTQNGFKINNERLEYLGDAVLGAIVAEYLFKIFPTRPEGFLTEMRSKIVSRASLNNLSQKLGLDTFVQHTNDILVYRSINGNAFEAFVGALFMDKGYDFTRKIIINRIIKLHIDIDSVMNTEYNFKSRLLEMVQKNKMKVKFELLSEKTKKNEKTFDVVVEIDGQRYGRASDHSIKGAEQLAAEKTLQMINNNKPNSL